MEFLKWTQILCATIVVYSNSQNYLRHFIETAEEEKTNDKRNREKKQRNTIQEVIDSPPSKLKTESILNHR